MDVWKQGRGKLRAQFRVVEAAPSALPLRAFSHSHESADSVDDALESSEVGIRALKISLVALMLTALFQVGIVAISGSVALLADTIHNFSDALTAVPL